MDPTQIREAVVRALKRVAPEADPATLDDAAPLREELDIDSMDFLNFVVSLHESLHVDVPEADYPRMQTLGGAVAYLASKLDRGAA